MSYKLGSCKLRAQKRLLCGFAGVADVCVGDWKQTRDKVDDKATVQETSIAETAAEFFKRRSEGATEEALSAFLDGVPNRGPDTGDENG